MSDSFDYVVGLDSGGSVTSPAELLRQATEYAKSTAYDAPISAYEQAQTRAQDALDNVGWGPTEGTDPATRQMLEAQLYDTGPGGTISASSAASQTAKPMFDAAYAALKADPKAVAALSPQQQMQFNFLAKRAGDISPEDFTSANQKILRESGIPEYSGAGAGRMQLNLLGNEPGRPGLLTQDLYRQIADIGTYSIHSDPSESWNAFEEIANNPVANMLAAFVPGGTAILAGIRIGQHGDITPADVIGILNGGAQVYSGTKAFNDAIAAGDSTEKAAAAATAGTKGIAELATEKGKALLADTFPDAYKAVNEFTQSVTDLKNKVVDTAKDTATDVTDYLGVTDPAKRAMSATAQAELEAGIRNVVQMGEPVDSATAAVGSTVSPGSSAIEQILVPGSRGVGVVDSALGAAAGVPAAVSGASGGTSGPEEIVVTGTGALAWKPNASEILNFLASNPSQAAIDAAKAQYHVTDEDIAKAKETEVNTITAQHPQDLGVVDLALSTLPVGDITLGGNTGGTPVDTGAQGEKPEEIVVTAPHPDSKVIDPIDFTVDTNIATTVSDTPKTPGVDTNIDLPDLTTKPPLVTGAPAAPAALPAVKTAEVDPYTWESIFRSKKQAESYKSPYDIVNDMSYSTPDDTNTFLRSFLRS